MRLTGAALSARVIRQLRDTLAGEYGLPMGEYTAEVDAYSLGSDVQPILTVTFTRASTGGTVRVTDIYPGDDGSILQSGSNYGHLAY